MTQQTTNPQALPTGHQAAYEAGYLAFYKGAKLRENPYVRDSVEYNAWDAGWFTADGETATE